MESKCFILISFKWKEKNMLLLGWIDPATAKSKKKIYALPLGHAHNITWNVYSIYVASSMTVLEKSLIEI